MMSMPTAVGSAKPTEPGGAVKSTPAAEVGTFAEVMDAVASQSGSPKRPEKIAGKNSSERKGKSDNPARMGIADQGKDAAKAADQTMHAAAIVTGMAIQPQLPIMGPASLSCARIQGDAIQKSTATENVCFPKADVAEAPASSPSRQTPACVFNTKVQVEVVNPELDILAGPRDDKGGSSTQSDDASQAGAKYDPAIIPLKGSSGEDARIVALVSSEYGIPNINSSASSGQNAVTPFVVGKGDLKSLNAKHSTRADLAAVPQVLASAPQPDAPG